MRSNTMIGTVLVRFNIGINDLMNSMYYTFYQVQYPLFISGILELLKPINSVIDLLISLINDGTNSRYHSLLATTPTSYHSHLRIAEISFDYRIDIGTDIPKSYFQTISRYCILLLNTTLSFYWRYLGISHTLIDTIIDLLIDEPIIISTQCFFFSLKCCRVSLSCRIYINFLINL